MNMGMEDVLVVEAGSVLTQDQLTHDHLFQGLWGDTRTTCRALILDVTNYNNRNNFTSRFLESSMLYWWPETRVVAVGGKAHVEDILLHHSLRNTVQALYLAIQDLALHTPPPQGNLCTRLMLLTWSAGTVSDRVWVYQRCLYCNKGEADVQLINVWNLTSVAQNTDNVFTDGVQNLMGHRLRVVSVPHFPYMDYDWRSRTRNNRVTPRDSLDVRLINTFSTTLNFTFEIHAEPDRSFGDEKDGIFTGMIGQLQREETDFTTIVAPTPGRLKVVEYLRGYPADMMVITSLKPALLPAHLALIRPFSGALWMAMVMSVVAWGVILWLLQRAWWWVAGGRRVWFNTALLYGWGALLDQPPSVPSINTSGRVLVGWWLVFCLVITTGFRSSLIAHLTVQGRSRTLDTFQDLVRQDSWRWATEPWLYKGAAYEYFSKHPDPVVNQIYQGMEVFVADEALQKVSQGGFSLIDFKIYVSVIVASRYTDVTGNTPFYISNNGISIFAASGWAIRKGAPFYLRFIQLVSRLEDAGIINYWTEKVIVRRVKENREAAALEPRADLRKFNQDESQEVALGLHHLQGAYYLLLLGLGIAFLTLLGENLAHFRSSPQERP
ncbi:glutamate receptor ionotropic, delta-1-like [Panulirus ornatus]|uniref:glutamate receptor ionotropic, delta-1-like n=1 Tax=Panulirus ornatus TaxID=150431 RepID=UPI003A85D417